MPEEEAAPEPQEKVAGLKVKFTIRYLHTDHNAPSSPPFPPLPPRKKLNGCFQFLLGITVIPREIEDSGYAKFWEVNKARYGLCENGELLIFSVTPFEIDQNKNSIDKVQNL